MSFEKTSTLLFPRANIWDTARLGEKGEIQLPYENVGGALVAPVAFFGVNENSQSYGSINHPLPTPFDPPDFQRCAHGPQRYDNADYCVTNVISRRVPNCTDYKYTAPVCKTDAIPTTVGCMYDKKSNTHYAQWHHQKLCRRYLLDKFLVMPFKWFVFLFLYY